jgi:hypothetical protein
MHPLRPAKCHPQHREAIQPACEVLTTGRAALGLGCMVPRMVVVGGCSVRSMAMEGVYMDTLKVIRASGYMALRLGQMGLACMPREAARRATCTVIDHPLTNGDPNAILIVTHNFTPGGGSGLSDSHAVGVQYLSTSSKWAIYHLDLTAMFEGTAFNVLVVKP